MFGDNTELAKRTISKLRDLLQRKGYEYQPVEEEKSFLIDHDFRKRVLDLPVLLRPEEVTALTDYFREGKYINIAKFFETLQETPAPKVIPPSPLKSMNIPHLKELNQFLSERQLTLRGVCSERDRLHTGSITIDAFVSLFSDLPYATEIANAAASQRTKTINYYMLQGLLETMKSEEKPKPQRKNEEDPPETVKRFARQITSRGIILQDIFLREKKTMSGMMNINPFISLIESFRTKLTTSELKEVTDFFTVDGMVDTNMLMRIVDSVVAEKYVPPPPEIDTAKVTQRVVDFLINRRINLYTVCKPFDVKGDGKIPKNKFAVLIINLNFDISDAEIEAMANAIAKDDMVDYQEFSKQIYEKRNISFDSTIESVQTKLKSYLNDKGIRLARFLQRFDREKSGLISIMQLAGVLRKIGFELTEHDIALLRDKYEDSVTKHFLRWKDLCADVDPEDLVSSSSQLQGSSSRISFSTSMRELMSTSTKMLTTYVKPMFTENEDPQEPKPLPENLIKFCGKVYHITEEFGCELETEFLIYDKMKKNRVPYHVAKQIFNVLPVKLQPEELEEFLNFYTKNGMVYYVQLCRDIDEFGNQSSPSTGISQPALSPDSEQDQDQEVFIDQGVMEKIAQECNSRGICIRDLFESNDKMKNGCILESRARVVFSQFSLDDQELEMIFDAFFCRDMPEYMNYRKFLEVMGSMEIEEKPMKLELTVEEQRELSRLLRKLNEMIQKKRFSWNRLFYGVDTDVILPEEFTDRLERIGSILKTSELQLLFRKYKDGELFEWKRFVEDATSPNEFF